MLLSYEDVIKAARVMQYLLLDNSFKEYEYASANASLMSVWKVVIKLEIVQYSHIPIWTGVTLLRNLRFTEFLDANRIE